MKHLMCTWDPSITVIWAATRAWMFSVVTLKHWRIVI